ncbi:Cobalamin adenosyltransferase [Candidatus Gugararchaeum adminiculabundum]|nr:Cobalamin adenosyltransferase [Candidatus Gugararchaeum adminiculabundum]
MKDYSRRHDVKKTSVLGSGVQVDKTDSRISAIGDIDELNSCLGLALSLCKSAKVREELHKLQAQMFRAGTDIASAGGKELAKRFGENDVNEIEGKIVEESKGLERISHFIYPGGSPGSAAIQVCRGVARRAERSILKTNREGSASAELHAYFNRLSDYLFVLARIENKFCGEKEEQWKP